MAAVASVSPPNATARFIASARLVASRRTWRMLARVATASRGITGLYGPQSPSAWQRLRRPSKEFSLVDLCPCLGKVSSDQQHLIGVIRGCAPRPLTSCWKLLKGLPVHVVWRLPLPGHAERVSGRVRQDARTNVRRRGAIPSGLAGTRGLTASDQTPTAWPELTSVVVLGCITRRGRRRPL
jgi:hypothetical protein